MDAFLWPRQAKSTSAVNRFRKSEEDTLLFVGHSESYATGHAALRNCGKTAYERRAVDSPRAP